MPPTKPSGGDPSIDREAPTPRASGSFMIFLARTELVIAQLEGHRSPMADVLLIHARAMAAEFTQWPDIMSSDVIDRLARTSDAYKRVTELEEQVRYYLAGGR